MDHIAHQPVRMASFAPFPSLEHLAASLSKDDNDDDKDDRDGATSSDDDEMTTSHFR